MTWAPNLPADTSKMRASAGLIRNDFAAIDNNTTDSGTGFARNHVTMADAANGGLHYRVDFYQAVASPALSGVASFYPKTVTNVEAFFKNAQADIQITNSALLASNGEGMLPGGLLIKCGSHTGNSTVTFLHRFPNACIAITCNAFVTPSGGELVVTTKTQDNFTVATSTTFLWVAVGN